MKKIINSTISAVIAAGIAFAGISPLGAQAQVLPVPISTPAFCYYFSSNLGLNSYLSSADANALQQILVAQGLWNPTVTITSYDRQVSIAVSALQEKYAAQILTPNGLTQGTGYFGPSTRAEVNLLYGCSNGGVPISTQTQTFMCPAGWTCTPPPNVVTITCPVGWTCVPTASLLISPPTTTVATTTTPNLNVNPNSFFTLVNQPTISKQNLTPGGATTTTMEYTASFNVMIKAVTNNLTLGLPNSTNPAFPVNSNSVAIYKDGTQDSLSNYQLNVSYSQPSGSILSPDGQNFSISEGQTVTVPVTYTFLVNGTSADTYAVQLQGIYSSLGLINSMMNQPTWRTASI